MLSKGFVLTCNIAGILMACIALVYLGIILPEFRFTGAHTLAGIELGINETKFVDTYFKCTFERNTAITISSVLGYMVFDTILFYLVLFCLNIYLILKHE